jgi:FtsH-binding integral membrane protein
MYSGAGVLTTLSVATILSHNAAVANSGAMFFTGLGVTVGGLVAMHFGKYHKDTTNNTTTNDPLRLLGYASLVTGMGITSAPAFALMDLSVVLPPALLMTNFVFCGAIIYAKRAPAGSLLKFGPALAGGLLGLVGTSLVALGSDMVFGPNMFSILVHNLDLYAGIPLFTGFVAYDTHVAMERYRLGDPDHLGTSVQLYLDFMNLLVRMMQIMSRRKD